MILTRTVQPTIQPSSRQQRHSRREHQRLVLHLYSREAFNDEVYEVNQQLQQTSAQLEREVEASRPQLAIMNEDQLDEFVDGKVENVRNELNRQVDRLKDVIKARKPVKPQLNDCTSVEEFEEKRRQYEEEVSHYKEFVGYATSILQRIVRWVADICDAIVRLFQELWTWICQKLVDIGTKIQEAVRFIKQKIDHFWASIFS